MHDGSGPKDATFQIDDFDVTTWSPSLNMANGTNGGLHNGAADQKTFFIDIDNCLYPKSYRIHDMMGQLIDDYFQNNLSLSKEEAFELHQRYYKDYGLAIEGLVRHHKVDPLEYNEKVDDALPLDDVIKPNPKLRRLLEDIDRSQVKLWLFTNAYITHGRRVVRLLDLEDCFDGITYCDYGAEKLICKPRQEMYDKAMQEAGATDPAQCYFVDDSALNAEAGKAYGWKSAHLVEPVSTSPDKPVADHQIQSLEELRNIFPELFERS
ncbi:putative suppressor of disruption of TFIIS [Elasticomyces elasticus]|nr:putative suppressor of disruption of TFIIS [Elasticomyces elasticus]KAK3638805.1 putative suppressor of disruption of TFIIS [Elasticomyces elasticus]KAK4913158.1 putative suppressor of disruption of TFIIS [Elasticomyces elasticus]KAK5715286.1 putative suppressor of disruption of TFIIS [Elasticomyces elasticus]